MFSFCFVNSASFALALLLRLSIGNIDIWSLTTFKLFSNAFIVLLKCTFPKNRVALLFLLFDLEILLVYPYVVSAYQNGIFGLIIMLLFFLVLTLGFAFELGKNALSIESRQSNYK